MYSFPKIGVDIAENGPSKVPTREHTSLTGETDKIFYLHPKKKARIRPPEGPLATIPTYMIAPQTLFEKRSPSSGIAV